jgi:hypothetical protein
MTDPKSKARKPKRSARGTRVPLLLEARDKALRDSAFPAL